jgi:transposase
VAQHNSSSKRYPAEFKRDAVELVRSSPDRTVAEIAAELGVSGQSLRNWVGQARIDAGEGWGGALTTPEREELRRLRREVAELRKEKEILRKAAAYFAAETTR